MGQCCSTCVPKAAGKTAGQEIWRIDTKNNIREPIRVQTEKYTELDATKCYIVLNTKDQTDLKGKWQIHLWRGDKCEDSEDFEAAKDFVRELWTKLDKQPVQYKEKQGRESNMFMEYFNEENKEAGEPEEVHLEEEKPKRSSTGFSLPSVLLETITLQAIFFLFLAVQENLIKDYIPTIPSLDIAYEYIPILKEYIPKTEDLQTIVVSSLSLWTALTVLGCLKKLVGPKRKCCCVLAIFKQIVNLGLILGTVFLLKSGMLFEYRNDVYYTDLVMERLAGAAFSLWLIIFGIKNI